MRPIKFRAWHKTLKEMLDVAEISYYAGVPLVNVFRAHHELGTERLDNKTVVLMQFTGLHDKNGKEIWEGDVVSFPQIDGKSIVSEIFYNENRAMFTTNPMIYLANGCGEVLGNIYENPEFLETK